MCPDYGLVPVQGYGDVLDAVRHLLRLALLVLQVGGVEDVLSNGYITTMPWYPALPSILSGDANDGAEAKGDTPVLRCRGNGLRRKGIIPTATLPWAAQSVLVGIRDKPLRIITQKKRPHTELRQACYTHTYLC